MNNTIYRDDIYDTLPLFFIYFFNNVFTFFLMFTFGLCFDKLDFNDSILNILVNEVLSCIDVLGSFDSGVLRNVNFPFIIHVNLYRELQRYLHKFQYSFD